MFRFTRTQIRHTGTTPTLGDIGEEQEEVEFEPMPETVPVKEPAAPTPSREPVPA